MMSVAEALEDVPAELWVEDGRITMNGHGDTTVYIKTPEHQPLSVREPEFTLFIKGDGFEATVSLNSEQADVLRAVLEGDGADETDETNGSNDPGGLRSGPRLDVRAGRVSWRAASAVGSMRSKT